MEPGIRSLQNGAVYIVNGGTGGSPLKLRSDPNSKHDARAASDIYTAHMKYAEVQARYTTVQRLGLFGLAAFFITVSAMLVVFAPDGRETATHIIAASLFALSVGVAGFGYFRFKVPLVDISAGSPTPVEPDR